MDVTANVYVGTYSKYNNGSIEGKWLDLTDYSDKDEFYQACKELHEDESDPEFMFQDYEVPEELEDLDLIGESGVNEELWEYLELLEDVDLDDENQLVSLWNTYCSQTGRGKEIYVNDDEFLNMYFQNDPDGAVRATCYGDYTYMDKYVMFNGYGNLDSYNDLDHVNIDKSELIRHMKETRNLYGW